MNNKYGWNCIHNVKLSLVLLLLLDSEKGPDEDSSIERIPLHEGCKIVDHNCNPENDDAPCLLIVCHTCRLQENGCIQDGGCSDPAIVDAKPDSQDDELDNVKLGSESFPKDHHARDQNSYYHNPSKSECYWCIYHENYQPKCVANHVDWEYPANFLKDELVVS